MIPVSYTHLDVYKRQSMDFDRNYYRTILPIPQKEINANSNKMCIRDRGYRVQSQVATRFRRWATQRLHEYIQKGFAMDDERLKQGGQMCIRDRTCIIHQKRIRGILS